PIPSLRPSLLSPVTRNPKPTNTRRLRAAARTVRLTESVPAPANSSGFSPAVTKGRADEDKSLGTSKRTAQLSRLPVMGQLPGIPNRDRGRTYPQITQISQ